MAKKLFLMIWAVMSFMMTTAQSHLPMQAGRVKTGTVYRPIPKSPIGIPDVMLDGNVLYFESDHSAFFLVLLDETGEEAYSIGVPSTVTTIVLPSSLEGTFELQLYDGSDYYYYCEIEL